MMKSTVALEMAMVVAVATTMTIAVAKKTVLNDAASFPDVSLVFEGQERAQRTKGRGKGLASFSLPWSFALRARYQSHVLRARPYFAVRSV